MTSTRSRTIRILAVLASTVLAATVFTGASAAPPANAVVVGVCTIKANNPHPSSHVSGTINAVGTVSCTLAMAEIYLAVYLEKSNGTSWSSWPFYDSYNTFSATENAATQCSQGPGTFRTRVSYVLQAPPGVNPAYASNNIYSPWKSVACGASLLAGGSGGTVFEVEIQAPASAVD